MCVTPLFATIERFCRDHFNLRKCKMKVAKCMLSPAMPRLHGSSPSENGNTGNENRRAQSSRAYNAARGKVMTREGERGLFGAVRQRRPHFAERRTSPDATSCECNEAHRGSILPALSTTRIKSHDKR